MKKIRLEACPKGVPSEIDVRLRSSLGHLCERFRDKPAFAKIGVEVTFGELDRLSRDYGTFLTQEFGLPKADRMAIILRNLPQ